MLESRDQNRLLAGFMHKSHAKILCIFVTVGAYAPDAPCVAMPLSKAQGCQ